MVDFFLCVCIKVCAFCIGNLELFFFIEQNLQHNSDISMIILWYARLFEQYNTQEGGRGYIVCPLVHLRRNLMK